MTDDPLPSTVQESPVSWNDLGEGAPTVIALAVLCGRAIVNGPQDDPTLSLEAQALLLAARKRGVFEIKGTFNAFDSIERFLAVHVEVEPEQYIVFRSKQDPQITVRFLDAFRELCAAGLVMHHLFREFSLTRAGFELAATIASDDVESLVALGVEV